MKHDCSKWIRHITSAVVLSTLIACSGSSDSPDEGGSGGGIIIGTGITLEGTTTSNKLFASNTIEARARSAERSSTTFSNQGRFTFDDLTGTGPWLVRSDLGNGNYLYGITTGTSEDLLVQNVHSYSDAVVRSWYTTNGLDVDAVFSSTDANAAMPSAAEVNAIYNSLTGVLTDVFVSYEIAETNLNTVQFAANGAGVDRFILQNPVIQNDGNITIIIFDPANDTASVAVQDLSLATDLTDADNIAPSAPSGLRALPSAMDEITLVWDVADDNIGIARYAIFRNGQEIATSPYPVYVDGGLIVDSENTYTVIAIDAAGNESSASLAATASPLATLDTTPPATPSSVLIDTRRGSLDLTWTQTGIGDVASFTVSRGTTPTNLTEYVNVNSTFLFDEAVNAGVQYCYEISAVDASGNASAPTGLVCATAPGTIVIADSSTPPETSAPGDGLTAPQIDVTNMACTQEVPVSSVRTDTTIPAGCYLAPRGITVSEPANLTLEPGVVIKFFTNQTLNVLLGGSLTAQGTAANPIVLTGTEPTPGHWRGLWFSSSSARNILDHVQIEYAGSQANGWGGLHFGFSTSATARVAMSNSTMRFNNGAGMSVSRNISLSTFDGNRYTGNALPVLIRATHVELLDKRSLYTGNSTDAIFIERQDMDADAYWPNLNLPYHFDDGVLSANAEFGVEPGTTIKFGEDAELFLGNDATLNLEGTEEQPITLSGIEEIKGGWAGIFMNSSDPSQLTNVIIRHAGGDDQEAAMRIRSLTPVPRQIGFDNVLFTENKGVAINADIDLRITEFNNVTITGNDGIADVGIHAAQQFNNPGNYTGNLVDEIVLKDAFLSDEDITLSNSDIPYAVTDIEMHTETLTLEAGVTLIMEEDSFIQVNRDGALTANGTAASPVTIAGREPIAGYWNGISYFFSNTELNRLTHTLVSDGGGTTAANAANLRLNCSNPSRLILENSRIENSAAFGLHVSATNCIVDIDAGTTFTNNALGDMN